MRYIAPSKINGTVAAPPSKSVGQRLLLAAGLAEGPCVIRNAGGCGDVAAAVEVGRGLGADVRLSGEDIEVRGGSRPRGGRLDCGESATVMRIAAPICALFPERFSLEGKGSLRRRPMEMIVEPLRSLGAECATASGFPPVSIRGPLRGGRIAVDGSLTSQLPSGILMALPLCGEDSEVEIRNAVSRGYLALTIAVMARFGVTIDADGDADRYHIRGGQAYRPGVYSVEGDWSAAAFWLVAGAVAGRAIVTNLAASQPDSAILEALRAAGAEVERSGDGARAARADLRGFEFDATQCPDLFPPLVALACFCPGTSILHGAGRLRHKESDRAAALVEEFRALGAEVTAGGDVMTIRGGRLRGGTIRSRGDHRIAMAGAVAGLASEEGVAVEGPECAAKSYPGFFDDLEALKEKT